MSKLDSLLDAEIIHDAELVLSAEGEAASIVEREVDVGHPVSVGTNAALGPRDFKWWFFLPLRALVWGFRFISLIVLLAVASTLPILQLASLGYMLEVGRRIAAGGQASKWLPGMVKAGRLGVLIAGGYLTWLPVSFIIDYSYSASIIAPGSAVARNWHIAAWVVSVLWVIHVSWAALRGGRWHHFLWPAPIRFIKTIWKRETWRYSEDAVWNYTVGLELPRLIWLGLRASIGAIAWLIIPSLLIIVGMQAHEKPGLAVLGMLGGGLVMAVVLLYLPFLQVQMARENRFGAVFDWRTVRRDFQRAPWAFFIAFFFTLLLALPLYLFRIEKLPSELLWLPSLFFVFLMLPARMLVGWALQRGHREIPKRFWLSRWTAWILQFAAVPAYLLILYLATFTSWDGALVVLLQHAFLVPVPFMGS